MKSKKSTPNKYTVNRFIAGVSPVRQEVNLNRSQKVRSTVDKKKRSKSAGQRLGNKKRGAQLLKYD